VAQKRIKYKLTKQKYDNSLENGFIGFIFVAIIVGIITLIAVVAGTYKRNDRVERWEHQIGFNKAMQLIASDKDLDKEFPQFTLALREIENESSLNDDNHILPSSLDPVRLNMKDYPGLIDEVGCIVVQDDAEDCQYEHSELAPKPKMALATAFSLRELPANERDDLNTIFPTNLPEPDRSLMIETPLTVVLSTIVLMAWIISSVTANNTRNNLRDYYYPMYLDEERVEIREVEPGAIRLGGFLIGLLFFPFFTISCTIAMLREQGSGRKALRRQKQEAERAEEAKRQRLENHPLKGALYSQYRRLQQLQELQRQHPNDTKIADAIRIVDATIKELEQIPDQVSLQAARSIAEESKKEAEIVRTEATSFLQSRSELDGL